MATRTCTVVLSPATSDVTSREVTVTFADGTPSVTLNLINSTATFSANDGQVITLTDVDENMIGKSTPSTPWSFTVGEGVHTPPTAVPATPSFVSVNCV